MASLQDASPMVESLHINYAVGYVGALRSITNEKEFESVTGLSLVELEETVIKQQDVALVHMLKTCPELMPESEIYEKYIERFLQNIGKNRIPLRDQ